MSAESAPCKDCGLDIEEPLCVTGDDFDHPGICCDCFDESMGMEPEFRSRPRLRKRINWAEVELD